MFRLSKRLIRYQSTLIPDRLFKVKETPQKINDLTISNVPENLPKISPQPNPPIFKSSNGFQSVHPYIKLVYSNINRVKKKKSLTVVKFFETAFIGKNLDYIKRQIAEEQLWILRPPHENFQPKKKKSKNMDYADYETIKGEELFDLQLRTNDVIVNYACIHELKIPDVLNHDDINNKFSNIEIIHEDRKLVVVNKPPGIPVHPSGMAYKFNTLLYLLTERENLLYGNETEVIEDKGNVDFIPKVFPCHRIDRESSGVLIFAKNPNKAKEMNTVIEEKKRITKRYIALVHGNFGTKIRISKHPVLEVDLAKRYESGGIGKKIQYGKSEFKPIHYDEKSDTTLLECKIYTGRKHQIRQHLRNLDFHIVNDPLYGIDGLLKNPMFHFPEKQEFLKLRAQYEIQLQNRIKNWEMESICTNCAHITYKEPNEDTQNYLRLHSFEYTYKPKDKSGGWSFKSKLPQWAKDILPENKIEELES